MSNIVNILRNAGGKSVWIGDCNINQNDKDVKVSLSINKQWVWLMTLEIVTLQ